MEGLTFSLLIYPAFSDMIRKQFYVQPVIVGTILFAFYQLWIKPESVYFMLFGLIPGMVLGLFSLLSKGHIGEGDVYLVLSIGFLWGIENTVIILYGALVLIGVFSLGLLILKLSDKTAEIPFAPALLGSFCYLIVFGNLQEVI